MGPALLEEGVSLGFRSQGRGPPCISAMGDALSAVVTGQPFKQEKATLASIRHQNHLEEITPGFLIQ